MKKIFIIIICIISAPFPAMAQMYQCTEEAKLGFELSKGKIKSPKFKTEKHVIDVDIENGRILNDEFLLSELYYNNGAALCEKSAGDNILLCTNTIGNGFAINLDNLQFTFATFWPVEKDQTAHIAHGKCKKL